MPGPLSGVRVLDLTTVVMGPYATQILGDFGADVVKVEPPEGDVMRYAWPFRHPGMGSIFLNTNRNKRSIVLDLKQAPARAACLALAARADVLVYNIRPQAMARLKLSYEDVREVNPEIIYAGCFGYSQRGPYAAKAAYDDLIQGAAGIPWLLKKQGAAEPRYAPMIVADRAVGQQVASAVSAALYHREKTGRGQRIDVPMFEHLLQMVLGDHLGGYTFEPQHGEPGYHRILAPDRRPYETRDGYVCALIYNDKQWKAFLEIIGKPEILSRPEFATQEARSRNYDSAYAMVAEELKRRTSEEWVEAFERADIPVQRMNSLDDIVADPHLAAIGYLKSVEHPSEGRIRSLAVPSEWSESQPEVRRHAPRLGEHTREVLREAGYSDAAVEALLASGAARI
ncbi:MAG: acetyl-CoA acetyltransferase [Betaproteobacteria bacterium RIFCSPHIGHO2_12_FULL_69_13]|nr:MAG: acetyl-CoA acetyltransferase [Betaproteobacteria bacterium RIFCSPHIGHO2_12_FULL_69_13]OGA67087.1 MAG: acetyl-CoA acetyltransferase [Betaproteobacteria bacterium RIFCSPLOWO2_12_FULL_68_20]